ncbi:hypothetical protein, partial [Stenotrophomonas sp. UBA7606]|uniref:hypothetical protein n=1 Tax=Stenotrophomonas sp. UBA7606 TaxID=1947559 RepID=UPI0025CE79CC
VSHGNQRASLWRWAAYVFNGALRRQIGLKTLSVAVLPLRRHFREGGNRYGCGIGCGFGSCRHSRLRGNDGCRAKAKSQTSKAQSP